MATNPPLTILNITEEEREELKELMAYLMRLDTAITQAWIKARAYDACLLSDEREKVEAKLILWLRAVAIGHIDFSLMGYYTEKALEREREKEENDATDIPKSD